MQPGGFGAMKQQAIAEGDRKQRIAVVADFDDTLTTQNVAHLLLKRFAPDALERFSTQYRSGQITFREYQELAFNSVDAPVEQMQQVAADEVELRLGLNDLLQALDDIEGELTIASAGLDLYIEPVLECHGLANLNVVCGSAVRNGSDSGEFSYDYPFADVDVPCRGDWATCKCKALEQAGESATTVFVGDGSTSDACAAENADYVFARDRLLRICEESGIDATPFEDFRPVTEFVAALGREPMRLTEPK